MLLSIKNLSKIFLPLFLLGCVNLPTKNEGICYSTPSWAIEIPTSDNKIYGLGVAKENINGANAQRNVAIRRAINEIASQLKVKVNNKFYNISSTDSGSHSTSVTFQTIDNQTVSAKIVKMCKNPNTGTLYVLMEAKR